jgi:hypothetical protein
VLDGDEATLLPYCDNKGNEEAADLTVVQLDASDMVGCPATSTLAAASLVLDRMVRQLAADRNPSHENDDVEEEEEVRRLGELLDRLLEAGAAAASGAGSSSRSGEGDTALSTDKQPQQQQSPPLLWDSLFDVGLTCLNFTARGSSGSPPHRPVPLAVAASLGAVVPQSIPELMAATVPHLLSQLADDGNDSGSGSVVSSDSRRRIERLLRDGPPAPAQADLPAFDECLEMLRANRTLARCRDDDDLLRRIVRDMVRDE